MSYFPPETPGCLISAGSGCRGGEAASTWRAFCVARVGGGSQGKPPLEHRHRYLFKGVQTGDIVTRYLHLPSNRSSASKLWKYIFSSFCLNFQSLFMFFSLCFSIVLMAKAGRGRGIVRFWREIKTLRTKPTSFNKVTKQLKDKFRTQLNAFFPFF